MDTSTITHECVGHDMTSMASPPNERISRWLIAEMKIAGRKDLPIHIDTDLEDEDDPFEPQPKQFLLTKEKREMINREVDGRREVYTIRKLRRREQDKRRRMIEQRRALRRSKRSLARLPNDLVLEVIRHTRPDDLLNFLGCGKTVYNVFKDNKAAVFRGIEAAQFSELEWAFGSGRRRSDEHKQALKDFLATYLLHPKAISNLPEIFDKIEKGELSDWLSIFLLQAIENQITGDVQYRMSMGIDMTRRSALCFRMFSSLRHYVEEKGSDRSEGKDTKLGKAEQIIVTEAMPVEARIKLFERQPAAIQAEIRAVLETEIICIVGHLDDWLLQPGELGPSPLMGHETRDWIHRYYSLERSDVKMKPGHMGLWIARLAAGYILDTLLPAHPLMGVNLRDIAGHIRGANLCFRDALDEELRDSKSTDGWWKESREFAERIRLNMGRLLKGTAVEEYLDGLS